LEVFGLARLDYAVLDKIEESSLVSNLGQADQLGVASGLQDFAPRQQVHTFLTACEVLWRRIVQIVPRRWGCWHSDADWAASGDYHGFEL